MKSWKFWAFFWGMVLATAAGAFAQELDELKARPAKTEGKAHVQALNQLFSAWINESPDSALTYARLEFEAANRLGLRTEKATALHNLGTVYKEKRDYGQALGYFSRALSEMEELKNDTGVAANNSEIGLVNFYKGNYELAEHHFNKALKISRALKHNLGIASALSNLGLLSSYKGEYEKSLRQHMEALRHLDAEKHAYQHATSLLNIGNVYIPQQDFDRAIQYSEKGLHVMETHGNKRGQATAWNNIGAAQQAKGDYEAALTSLHKALALEEELSKGRVDPAVYNNIGNIYYFLNRYNKAVEYQLKALEANRHIGDQYGEAGVMNNLGVTYDNMGEYNRALVYLNGGLTLAQAVGARDLVKDFYVNLSQTHSNLGDFRSAYRYYRRYAALKDSIFNQQKNEQITEMQTRYETEQKTLENEKLRAKVAERDNKLLRQRMLSYAVAGVLLFALVFALLLFNRYRLKIRANRLLESQKVEIEEKNNQLRDAAVAIKAQNVMLERLSIVASRTDNAVILADADGNIEWVNDGYFRMAGFAVEPAQVLPSENLFTANGNGRKAGSMREAVAHKKSLVFEDKHTRADGEPLYVASTMTPILDHKGEVDKLIIIETDITARKVVERQLHQSLKEKEILLKEIHHRVKNNLQVISSLLNMQSRTIADEKVLQAFKESQSRVKSMALIHQKLYQSDNLSCIDMQDYFEQLVSFLTQSFNRELSVCIEARGVMLEVDTATPLGLIVNELVCNTLKHAFPDGQVGHLDLRLTAVAPHEYELTVADNGVGLPPLDLKNVKSLGMKLVHSLARQIQGKVYTDGEGGASFRIPFHEIVHAEAEPEAAHVKKS